MLSLTTRRAHWSFVYGVSARSAAKTQASQMHVADVCAAAYDKAFISADLSGIDNVRPWSCKSSVEATGVSICRTGISAKKGTPWTFTDKITFRLVIDAALTPPVKRQLRAMASQHGSLMAVEEANCSDIFRIGSAPAANVQKSVFRRHAEDPASQPHTAAGQRKLEIPMF